MTYLIHRFVGYLVEQWHSASRKDRTRGLSQSTENAILIAGAVAIALVVVAVVKAFVESKLGALK